MKTRKRYKRKTVYRSDRPVPELNKKYIDLVCETFLKEEMWKYAVKARRALYFKYFENHRDFTSWALTWILTDMLYWEKEINPKLIVGFMRTSIIRNLDVMARKYKTSLHREDIIFYNSKMADVALQEVEYEPNNEEEVLADFFNYIIDNYSKYYSGKDIENHIKIAWDIINGTNGRCRDQANYNLSRTHKERQKILQVRERVKMLYNEYSKELS